jgi:hypothetical protein
MSKRTEGVKELKAQLNKCLVLPPGVARTERIKMIMRIELARDGALARDPIVVDGAAPAIGYAMVPYGHCDDAPLINYPQTNLRIGRRSRSTSRPMMLDN